MILTLRGPERAAAMLQAVAHRGPDGQKIITRGGVSIGHARLAIVDVSTGGQPYEGQGGAITAFNGELFNYHDLGPGTEVELLSALMHAHHRLDQILNGYYAVIRYTPGRGEIELVRDPFGVMPLYYTRAPFEVASERKALGRDAQRVPAGARLRYNLRTHKICIERSVLPLRLGAGANVAETRRLFDQAVARVARHGDGRFAVALSGGLDSAMVLTSCVNQGLVPEQIITTFIGSNDDAEISRARRLVAQLGVAFRWKPVFAEVVPDHRTWIESPPNPIRDFAFRRQWNVARHCASKVILCGEGADELGLGYPAPNADLTTPIGRHVKRLALIKAQDGMTLDRVNKAGAAWGKEFRVPFLDMDFAQHAFGIDQSNKAHFRKVAALIGVPDYIITAAKYSTEESLGHAQEIK